MEKFFSKNYWSVGFQSRLYDYLSPESYFDSMQRVVAALPNNRALRLLDAGCGSGLLLKYLATPIRIGMVYTGMDLLISGVEATLQRAQELHISDRVTCFQSDLASPLPVDAVKYDVVVGHFSLYTLASDELRKFALENLKTVMKPEGLLVVVNPSVNYDANLIIEQSIQLVGERYGPLVAFFKQYLVYPFTKAIGLRFIQKQLRLGKWKAYTREEFTQEIERAGFEVQHVEEVYAGSAFLGIGRQVAN
jgi:ubiquinone/menaquinone biosynthesis C-methylase UbiE